MATHIWSSRAIRRWWRACRTSPRVPRPELPADRATDEAFAKLPPGALDGLLADTSRLARFSEVMGLEILAFPSNDFGGQEPGANEEIKKFCELRYRTTFPLFAKIPVKGPRADPLYRYLTTLPDNGGEVTWNFDKFLVDPAGNVVAHLDSGVEPTSDELKRRIEAILPKTKT